MSVRCVRFLLLVVCLWAMLSACWAADVRKVVDQVGDAVVSIEVDTGRGKNAGSGFIVNPDGCILTSAHVINKAKKIKVKLTDGKEYAAKLVAKDTNKDLAIIRIDVHNLPVAAIGNAKKARAGDSVVAIGCPRGLDHTVTSGIVSSREREIDGKRYIQTDAALNEGNSGGPLLNDKAEVIGINTMILKDANQLGFAVPINDAYELLNKNNVPVITTLDNKDLAKMTPSGKAGGQTAMKSKKLGWIWYASGGLLVVVAAAVVALLLMRKKKTRRRRATGSEDTLEITLGPSAQKTQAPPQPSDTDDLDDIEIELK